MIHTLKIKWEYGKAVLWKDKTFELRLNDRNFQQGDHVKFIVVDKDKYLNEWQKQIEQLESNKYEITYVLRNCREYGLKDNYCIFSIKEELA